MLMNLSLIKVRVSQWKGEKETSFWRGKNRKPSFHDFSITGWLSRFKFFLGKAIGLPINIFLGKRKLPCQGYLGAFHWAGTWQNGLGTILNRSSRIHSHMHKHSCVMARGFFKGGWHISELDMYIDYKILTPIINMAASMNLTTQTTLSK